MSKVYNALEEEIIAEFDELKKKQTGSEEYKATCDGLSKLMDRAIAMKQYDFDADFKCEQLATDNELKKKAAEDTKKDNRIRNVLTVLGIVVPAGVTIWGTNRTIKFETDGHIPTFHATREFFRNLFMFTKK